MSQMEISRLTMAVLNLEWVHAAELRHKAEYNEAELLSNKLSATERTIASLGFNPKRRAELASIDANQIEESMFLLKALWLIVENNRRRNLALISPIDKLPNETLHRILSLALPDFGALCGSNLAPQYHNSHSTVYSLGSVSRRFRSIMSDRRFSTRLGLAFFIRPIPDGPWKESFESFPWDYPDASDFNHECCSVVECIPRNIGPASHYQVSFPKAAAHYAKLASGLNIDIDLRLIPDITDVIVFLAKFCQQWGTFLCDQFYSDTRNLLDTISKGDEDISMPWTDKDDLQTYLDRDSQRQLQLDRGILPANRFTNLHTLYLRDRYRSPRPERLEFPFFIQHLTNLRHLSLGDYFYWDMESKVHYPWPQLETLELYEIRRFDMLSRILAATAVLKNLIIHNRINILPRIRFLALVNLPCVVNLTYVSRGDDNMNIFTHFSFPSLESLTLSSNWLHSSAGWLGSVAAERTIMKAIYRKGNDERLWMKNLKALELMHLGSAEMKYVRDDFRQFASSHHIENVYDNGKVSILCKTDAEVIPLEERFLEYTRNERCSLS